MGIPSYFSYIIKNHSNIIRNLQHHKKTAKTAFHGLYMDCNSIIYDAVHTLEKTAETQKYSRQRFEQSVIDAVIFRIRDYITMISPISVLYIAFDGVAPLAKMDQQRSRRYKTAFMSDISYDNKENVFSKKNDKKWNTTAITPGTLFMDKLSKRIHSEFSTKNIGEMGQPINALSLLSHCLDVKVRVIVSTSTEPGEGEHKMFAYIRKHAQPNENIAVYGLDSDLIMLSILHSTMCSNIFIFRETPQFSKSILPVHLRNDTTEFLFLDIRALTLSILYEMGSRDYNVQRIYDYILVSVLLGNDFLPHMVSLNLRGTGMELILQMYNEHIAKRQVYLVSADRKIIWKNVKYFIGKLADIEHANIVNEFAHRTKLAKRKYPENTPEEREFVLLNTPLIYRGEEEYICPTEEYWDTRYYRVCFPTLEPVRDICVNYLEGMEWVFRYYSEGCPHWRWKYQHHYPPLLVDLYKAIPETDCSLLTTIPYPNRPFHPLVQLSYVTPPISQVLLPANIQEWLRSKYADLFIPIHKTQFSWMFCKYVWEAHVLLPDISMDVLGEWEKRISRKL
jgi:5'-3' exonuclease